MDKEFVRGGLGGDVREDGGITIHVTIGGEVCGVFHLGREGLPRVGKGEGKDMVWGGGGGGGEGEGRGWGGDDGGIGGWRGEWKTGKERIDGMEMRIEEGRG